MSFTLRRSMVLGLLVAGIAALSMPPLAIADEPPGPAVMMIDGESVPGNLVGFELGVLQLVRDDEADQAPRTVEAGAWMRWGHPLPPEPRGQVYLSPGSPLIARQDWSGKPTITVRDRVVRVRHALFGEVAIPAEQVEVILLAAGGERALARRILEETQRGGNRETDRVWLIGGDSLTGQIVALDQMLTFQVGSEELQLVAGDVAALAFSKPRGAEQAWPAPRYRVGLADGTLVDAVELRLDQEQLELTTPQGLRLAGQRVGDLKYVQVVGKGVAYLSDLQPIDFRHTPYFDAEWPLFLDRNLEGDALSVAGDRYEKGVAMHTAARAVYQVPSGAERFCAEIGIDGAAGDEGSAVFRVYVVRGGEVQGAYESPVVRGGEPPRSVSVDLAEATAVILVVDFADFGDQRDHCNWLDARFVMPQ